MALQRKYRKSGEKAIQTFQFFDLAEGTGIVEFFGARVSVDATAANDDYILTTSTLTPSSGTTDIDNNTDIDFDVTFNIPKVVDGNCYIVAPIYIESAEVSLQVTAVHFDGTTETTLVATTTFPIVSAPSSTVYQERSLVISIPRTKFAQGETLRFTITATDSTGTTRRLYHDPTGITSNFTRTGGVMSFFVPFRIQ